MTNHEKIGAGQLPFEADPEVWNTIMHASGVQDKWRFIKVNELGCLEEDLARMMAVVYIFPQHAGYQAFKVAEETRLAKLEQSISPNVIFFKQVAHSHCGMMALLHALGNNDDKEIIGPGTLHNFFVQAKGMSPDERVDWLSESNELRLLHEAAKQTTSAAAAAATNITEDDESAAEFHYVCFVVVDGHLYELDSQFALPLNHGRLTSSLAKGAEKYIQQYQAMEPKPATDAILALVASP
ncbi:peptidase C12, ubiquitin carboxyl-terminal hydrolase [Gongronella butleri]|nr:peptidase C12, ubiquitin carboxyl-terminal hydrolase [Gongronella butleri]